MKPGGLPGFYDRGGYMLPCDEPTTSSHQYAVFAVGEAESLGSRGGGFEPCSGVPGQVAVGRSQLAWAVQWAGPLRYGTNYVGNIHLPDVEELAWKGNLLRVSYVSRLERVPGLLLVRFRSELAVDLVKAGLVEQSV